MPLHCNGFDIPTIQDALAKISNKRTTPHISNEMVAKTIKRLEGNQFKKCIISYPANGVWFYFTLSKKQVRHNPCSRFIKWVRGCFIKKDI